MGRIVSSVTIDNAVDTSKSMHCEALVDTGTSQMVLPSAWKGRLGDLRTLRSVELETATQAVVQGEICGPVQIHVKGFEPVFSEVFCVDMESEDGSSEPLLGYIMLERCQAAIDMPGHRLIHVKRMDLKKQAIVGDSVV